MSTVDNSTEVREKCETIQHNLNQVFNDTTQDPKILER